MAKSSKTPMTPKAASRISSTAKSNSGQVPRDSFSSRASSAAATNSKSSSAGSKKG